MAKLRQQTERIGYPVLGLVAQLGSLCRDKLGEYWWCPRSWRSRDEVRSGAPPSDSLIGGDGTWIDGTTLRRNAFRAPYATAQGRMLVTR